VRAPVSIRADVDRGFEVVAEIETLKKELKGITARLTQDALDRPDQHAPLADAERLGKQFIARGTALALPIVITADKLVQTCAVGSEVEKRIAAAAGDQLDAFYKLAQTRENIFADGQLFRIQAAVHLGDKAPAFIAACRAVDKHGIPKNDVRIEWQAAAALAKLEEVAG